MISNAIIQFRTTRIGGSDVAAILGKAEFTGPASLAQRILKASNNNDVYNPNFEFGNRWESQTAQLFAENHPEYVVVNIQDAYEQGILTSLPGFRARPILLEDGSVVLVDPEHDVLVLNADYLVISRFGLGWGVLEIKTASEFTSPNWPATGSAFIPAHYEDQPRHYCARIGGSFVHVAVLIGQRDYREYILAPYSTEEAEQILHTLLAWYDRHITQRIPVPPTFNDYGAASITEEYLVADTAVMDALLELKELEEEMRPLNKRKDAILANLKEISATHAGIITPDGEAVYTHKAAEKIIFDTNALARFEPAIYAKYLTKGAAHRFEKAPGFKNLVRNPLVFKPAMNG